MSELRERPNPFKPVRAPDKSRLVMIENLFSEIDEWYSYEAPGHFDYSFVESLHESFDERGDLTDNQLSALTRIRDHWVRA